MQSYNREIRERLTQLSDPKYQAFTEKLLPGTDHIMGVRLPELRRIARELAKGDWKTYLEQASDASMEEIMLQGMTLGYAKGELKEKRPYLEAFLPKIDNWSVCDSTCSSLKLAKTQPGEMWEFLQGYLSSQKEYELRFVLVQLLDYYVNEEYLARVLAAIDGIRSKAYYVQMAQAWAVSICYREFPEQTIPFLQKNHLDDVTHNKAIQKITESLKVGKEEKKRVRELKRRQETSGRNEHPCG